MQNQNEAESLPDSDYESMNHNSQYLSRSLRQ